MASLLHRTLTTRKTNSIFVFYSQLIGSRDAGTNHQQVDGKSENYLDSDGEIVFFDVLVVERMIDFDVGPGVSVISSLLQVERVVFVGLGR